MVKRVRVSSLTDHPFQLLPLKGELPMNPLRLSMLPKINSQFQRFFPPGPTRCAVAGD
jgi:hypothetical protein